MKKDEKLREDIEDAKELIELMRPLTKSEKNTVKDIITGMKIMKEMYDVPA